MGQASRLQKHKKYTQFILLSDLCVAYSQKSLPYTRIVLGELHIVDLTSRMANSLHATIIGVPNLVNAHLNFRLSSSYHARSSRIEKTMNSLFSGE